ncbi:MAG TPA: 3-keto-5-aminohexanoate cleavage protein [Porticoccaceae bacterium]|nr:3-keto-5-aminohexanoate cleavage protein [Porticoccaceae bacterium]
MNKLIIEARINEYAGRGQNPNVPWMPEEIAETAAHCREAGASIVHFHARTAEGEPEHRIEVYADIIQRIRARSDILIHPTLGAFANDGDASERIQPILELAGDPATRPHFAPLDMGTTNIDAYDPDAKKFRSTEAVYTNTTKTLQYFAERLKQSTVRPYASLWNVGFTRQFLAFMDMNLIAEPAYACLIMTGDDLPAAHPGTEQGLDAHTAFIPKDKNIVWTAMNHGGDLFPLLPRIINEGGHVSIGLGDWPYLEINERQPPTNEEVIAKVTELASLLGRETASPSEAARALGVNIL